MFETTFETITVVLYLNCLHVCPSIFQIFKGCGTPRRNPSDSSSRFKRQSGESGTDYYSGADFMNFGNRRHETSNEKPATAGGTNLDRLVQDIKDKVGCMMALSFQGMAVQIQLCL